MSGRDDDMMRKHALLPMNPIGAALNYTANTARESSLLNPVYDFMTRSQMKHGLQGVRTAPIAEGIFASSPLSQYLDPVFFGEVSGESIRDQLRSVPEKHRGKALELMREGLSNPASLPSEFRSSARVLNKMSDDDILRFIGEEAPQKNFLRRGGNKAKAVGNIIGGIASLGTTGQGFVAFDPAGAAAGLTSTVAPIQADKSIRNTVSNIQAGRKGGGFASAVAGGFAEGAAERGSKPVGRIARQGGKFVAPAVRSILEQAGKAQSVVGSAVESGGNAYGKHLSMIPEQYRPTAAQMGTITDMSAAKEMIAPQKRFQKALWGVGKMFGKFRFI